MMSYSPSSSGIQQFSHATSFGRFFTIPHFMSQEPIEALNPSFNPNTVPTSTLIDNDHDFCAHNPAHNLAHNHLIIRFLSVWLHQMGS